MMSGVRFGTLEMACGSGICRTSVMTCRQVSASLARKERSRTHRDEVDGQVVRRCDGRDVLGEVAR